jgi:hypothetical protein
MCDATSAAGNELVSPAPVAAQPPVDEMEFRRRIQLGISEAEAGRDDAAERIFRELLASARDTGSWSERIASSSLLTLFAREARDLETLVLSRRHLALSRATGDAEDLCYAYAPLLTALAGLEDWRRFDVAARDAERALDAYTGRHSKALRRHLLRMRIDRELARGDTATAGELLSKVHALYAAAPEAPQVASATRVSEALIALAIGRPDRARTALDRIEASGAEAPLEAEFLRARCALAIEGPPAAIAAIGRVTALLESRGPQQRGVAHHLTVARQTAQLADRIGAGFELTKRAYDVAAAIVLLRASEIERVTRELPELGDVDPEDARALAAYRIRFASEQKDLLAAVADLLRRRAAAGDLPSWAAAPPNSAVHVCPWCLRVRTQDGSLLPIGHYLPTGPGLRVDNGMCDACAARTRPA